MNPIVNTQRDSTQSGVDGALSSTPHRTGSIAFRRVWKKPSLGHLGLTTSRVCLWNTFVTIGTGGNCFWLLPSSSDGNRKPPAIPDRHKAEPKAEKCANRHSRGGRNMQHLSDHHDGSASQGSNGVKVRA